MPVDPTIGIVQLSILGPMFLVAFFMLWQQRDKYNLRGRGLPAVAWQTFLVMAFLAYYIVVYFMYDTDEISCWTGTGLGFFASNILLVGILRQWVILFRFRIARKLASFAKTPNHLQGIMEGEDGWFFRNRFLITRKVVYGTYFAVTIVMLLLALPVAFLPSDCKAKRDATTLYIFASCGLWAFALIMVTCFIRKDDGDAFGIRSELRIHFYTSVLILVTAGPLNVVDAIAYKVYIDWIIVVCVAFGFVSGTCYPLYVAYRYKEDGDVKDKFEGITEIKNLHDLISVEFGYESFLKYTMTEFAQENVMCWKAIQNFEKQFGAADYKAFARRSECMAEAEKIMVQFIHDDSPSQVNLSATVRNGLVAAWSVEKQRSNDGHSTMKTKPATVAAGGAPHQPTTPTTPTHKVSNASSTASTIVSSLAATTATATGSSSTASQPSTPSSIHAPSPTHKMGGAGGLGSVPEDGDARPAAAHLSITIKDSGPPIAAGAGAGTTPSSPSTHTHTPVGGAGAGAVGLLAPPSPAGANSALLKPRGSNSGLISTDSKTATTLSIVAMFEPVKNELYKLMQTDLLPRYLKSQQWFDFLTQLKDYQAEKEQQKIREISHGKGSSNQHKKKAGGADEKEHSHHSKSAGTGSHTGKTSHNKSANTGRKSGKNTFSGSPPDEAGATPLPGSPEEEKERLREELDEAAEREHSTTSNPAADVAEVDDDAGAEGPSSSHGGNYLPLADEQPVGVSSHGHVRLDPTLGLNPISSPGLVELENIIVDKNKGVVKVAENHR